MPDQCGLVQLDALGSEAVHCLETHLLARLRQRLHQIAIVHLEGQASTYVAFTAHDLQALVSLGLQAKLSSLLHAIKSNQISVR